MQISEVPVILVSGDRVSCDGGTDPRLGHPKVYLNLHKGEPVSCSYCGLRCALLHLFDIFLRFSESSAYSSSTFCLQLSEVKGPPSLDTLYGDSKSKTDLVVEIAEYSDLLF
jgi:uncharacterized Zn-finger protein